MCQRRLLRRMERHSTGTAGSTAQLHCENRSEHFTQNLLEKGSSRYTIALEELEGYIVDEGILYNLHIAYKENDSTRAMEVMHQWADLF